MKKQPLRRLILILTCLALLLLAATSYAGELKPFTSDGCSSFPDGPPSAPDKWKDCCIEHDKAYWLGGTYDERSEADQQLKNCISKVENKALADIMWAGVRAGGSPYWPTRFRWAYGWPYTRGYRAISPAERKRADELMQQQK